jgi:3-hydroxyisobutyrate dehydrogenase
MKIGLIGTGLLGNAVGVHLVKSGHDLWAFNRTKSKTAELEKNGAYIVDSAKEVAERADIVFVAVKNADAVRKVAFGESCISCGAHDGLVVADMSTINPRDAKEIAEKFQEKNITYLGTPVMGGPNVAIDGKLVMMVDGDKSAYEKYLPIFNTVASSVFYLGPNGIAHSVKLSMNLQIAMLALALSEGIILARSSSVDPEVFLQILNSTYFKTGMSQTKAYKMIKDSFEPTFTLRNLKKDLDTINEAAKEFGVTLPMATKANEIYQKAVESGFGDIDYTGILAYLKDIQED